MKKVFQFNLKLLINQIKSKKYILIGIPKSSVLLIIKKRNNCCKIIYYIYTDLKILFQKIYVLMLV